MSNLLHRTLSGILFLAVMIGAILYGGLAFLLLSCLIVGIGTLEFIKLSAPESSTIQKVLSITAAICLVWFAYSLNPLSGTIFILALVSIFIAALYKKSETPFQNISSLILPVLYIALPFALMNLLTQSIMQFLYGNIILAFFILIWANDVGAYCFGCTLGKHGRHKLFERISPKKSWEGFIGGIITAVAAGVLCAIFLLKQPVYHWIIIAVIASVFGTFGDLIESMLKRSAGVKDSGNLIPGHGGILDRFDAAIFAFPPVFVYMSTFII